MFSKDKVRLVTFVFSLLLVGACQSKPEAPQFDLSVDLLAQGDHVVLLHGMWRDERAMRPVEKFLLAQGYQVSNVSYPSTEFPIETLVENYLAVALENLDVAPDQKVHFVTHSMGGILVRYYLKHNHMPNLGRVVMIAPPNQGTELAGIFEDTEWVQTRSGPAREQLKPDPQSWVNQLGSVNFELGVIAGNHNGNWITDYLLPGDDDGVVSVESTKVANMQDFMTVPEKHYFMRSSITVLQQAAFFLKYGYFYRQG